MAFAIKRRTPIGTSSLVDNFRFISLHLDLNVFLLFRNYTFQIHVCIHNWLKMSKLKSMDVDLDHQQGVGITQLEQKWALSDNQNSSQLHHNYYQSTYLSISNTFQLLGWPAKSKCPKSAKSKCPKLENLLRLVESGPVGELGDYSSPSQAPLCVA